MTASTAKKGQKAASSNGKPENGPSALVEAIAYEQAIADEAAAIREDATELTPALLMELLPLLRKPIPPGFIVTTPATEGKPYPSTGIKSLQVQIDRLDNVLGALNWSWLTTWEQDGKVAEVVANVWGPGGSDREALVTRRARGGVNRGSTIGNVYKGSETNAAKLCFARLGAGHEVYLGATDFDPDVDPDAAKEQSKEGKAEPRKLSAEQVEKAEQAVAEAGLTDALPHKLRSFGVKSLADLTYEQGFNLKTWIEERSAAKGGEA